ncbi:hypothetical protein KFL_010520010 [Klebsormidium nitens]|uniref:Uncharacterized protein n=1 Tax=Klebsormidium nitens TaxID=105231 RepID=A0A1Y1INW1_KLENI|nr:hypothetical protein KFL_010520010 [Klebsormidium nitens]|eukprot:GAQ92560.1 hypothetical protein KFL_010520010 [Klebsormidium nitens]
MAGTAGNIVATVLVGHHHPGKQRRGVNMLDFAACLASLSEGSVDLTMAPPGPQLELLRGLALVDMYHGELQSRGFVGSGQK